MITERVSSSNNEDWVYIIIRRSGRRLRRPAGSGRLCRQLVATSAKLALVGGLSGSSPPLLGLRRWILND